MSSDVTIGMLRLLLASVLSASAAFSAGVPGAGRELARSVTIYRDSYGVPHIYAKTDAGAAFGLMYAQAEDNFWQLETDMIRLVGRAAELDGPRGLAGDILVRAYESEKQAKEQYARTTPALRALCDGFAAGVNYYLETHSQVKPRLITRFEPWFILAEEHRGPACSASIRAAQRKTSATISRACRCRERRVSRGRSSRSARGPFPGRSAGTGRSGIHTSR